MFTKAKYGILALACIGSWPLGFASEDEGSKLKAFQEGKTVMLPPFITSGDQKGLRFHGRDPLYGNGDGIEVLSYADGAKTQDFIGTFLLRQRELAELLPKELRFHQSAPLPIILVTADEEKAMKLELVDDMRASGRGSGAMLGMIPQMTLSDSESDAMLFELTNLSNLSMPKIRMGSTAIGAFAPGGPNEGRGYADVYLTEEYVDSLVSRRAPPLPSWFQYTFRYLYGKIRWTSREVLFPPVPWPLVLTRAAKDREMRQQRADDAKVASKRVFTKTSYTWRDYEPAQLMPMAAFIDGAIGQAGEGVGAMDLWVSQGVLFIRWAYEDPSQGRRRALWDFVDKSSRGAITEVQFRQCFGIGYDGVEKELTAYLPVAMKDSLLLVAADSVSVPEIELRTATRIQIFRVNGNWQQQEIKYVRKTYPDLVNSYIDRADADFTSARQAGLSDPPFLATVGLYRLERGQEEDARSLLQEAANAHVPRPSVYVELARLLLREAVKQSANGKLGPDEVEPILRLLKESSKYAPPQIDSYLVAADALSFSDGPPSPEGSEFLELGRQYFPTEERLVDREQR